MDKHSIISRLLALPAEIATAEECVLQANGRLVLAKEALQTKDDSLLLGNVLDGKNAETRAAQARQYTQTEREMVSDAELLVKNASAKLNQLRDEFRALRSVADLLRGDAA